MNPPQTPPPLPPGDWPEAPPPAPRQPRNSLLGKLLAPLAIAGLFLAKFGKLILASAKFLPAILKTGGTMIISLWIYATLWGWKFAAGFLICLLIHELGHIFAARQVGVRNTSAPIFIPFMGAFILQKEAAGDAWKQAVIGIGGPLFGAWAAAVSHYLFIHYNEPLFGAIAYTAYFLNLFNLIPFGNFDGGHITGALSPWLWAIGLAVIVVLLIFNPAIFILWLILLMDLPRVWRMFKMRHHPEIMQFYAIPQQKRWTMGAAYFALMGLLVLGMQATHNRLLKEVPDLQHSEADASPP
jgi:Zn-dependent protease